MRHASDASTVTRKPSPPRTSRASRTGPRAPLARLWPAAFFAIMLVTAYALTSVSVWLAATYLIAMLLIVLGPEAARRPQPRSRRRHEGPRRTGPARLSSRAVPTADDGTPGNPPEACNLDPEPADAGAVGRDSDIPDANLASDANGPVTRRVRGRGRGRGRVASTLESARSATWVQVAPGKFVRVDDASASIDSGTFNPGPSAHPNVSADEPPRVSDPPASFAARDDEASRAPLSDAPPQRRDDDIEIEPTPVATEANAEAAPESTACSFRTEQDIDATTDSNPAGATTPDLVRNDLHAEDAPDIHVDRDDAPIARTRDNGIAPDAPRARSRSSRRASPPRWPAARVPLVYDRRRPPTRRRLPKARPLATRPRGPRARFRPRSRAQRRTGSNTTRSPP